MTDFHIIAFRLQYNIEYYLIKIKLTGISPEFQLVELLPQGCQHPPLLDPGLSDQADGLPRLLVSLVHSLAMLNASNLGLWRWYLVWIFWPDLWGTDKSSSCLSYDEGGHE